MAAEDHHRRLRLLFARQAERERRAVYQLERDTDAPPVRLHDGAADVEAEARALRASGGGVIHSLEALEDAILLAQGDALAVVADADDHLVRGDMPTHADTAALGGIFEGVVEQVEQHLLDALAVGQHQWESGGKADADGAVWAAAGKAAHG